MKFKIEGTYPVLRLSLDKDESIVTSAGSLAWMTDNFHLSTRTNGGLGKGIFRALSGETVFQNVYTSLKENQEIAFASSLPGVIRHIKLKGNSIIAQKTAFLASTPEIDFKTVFTKKIASGFLGGEGFMLQQFSGYGDVFLEADGDLVEFYLEEGETKLVDQGNVFLFDDTVDYGIHKVKGVKNMFLGGEGLFLVKLTGPGRIVLQTLPVNKFSKAIKPHVIEKQNQ